MFILSLLIMSILINLCLRSGIRSRDVKELLYAI